MEDENDWGQLATTPSRLVDLIVQDNISNEQAVDYLMRVQSELRTYVMEPAPPMEPDRNWLNYIRLWRDLFEIANAYHDKWNLSNPLSPP